MLNSLIPFVFFFSAVHAGPVEVPFWKAKEKVHERILSGDVIVSVREESGGDAPQSRGRHKLLLGGGGLVNAPCDFVYKTALNFEEIAGLTGYIRDPKYDPATHILQFTVSAFFHESKVTVKVEPQAEPAPAHIDNTIMTPPMKGFFYRLQFDPTAAGKCEVGIKGDFQYDEFPIHRLFLEFGLEVVFQNMAKRLRSHVESRYIRPH